MKLTIILCALLALATGGLMWQVHEHGKEVIRSEALSREVKSNSEIMTELRELAADTKAVLAQLREDEQQRNAQGEKRRENIREAAKDDTCANTVVPDAISNSLQNNTTITTSDDALRSGAKQPDSSNTNTVTAQPSNVGRDRNLE